MRSWTGAVWAIWLLVRVISGIGSPDDAAVGASAPAPPAASSIIVGTNAVTHRVVEPHRDESLPPALRFEVGPTAAEWHPFSVGRSKED